MVCMRWKRGLFRLWIIFSALWVAPMWWLMADEDIALPLRDWILLVLAPPLVVLVIGLSLAWALSGFSDRDS